ncbi:hypothetical protein D3C80_1084640 [compost metagenome]
MCLGQNLRLVLLNPKDLRQCKPFQCLVSGDVDQLRSKRLLDLAALCCSAGVIPENRRTQYVAFTVYEYKPVHLAGEADSVNL